MECQILIKGSLSEIQQVLRVLTTGTHVLATIEETVGSMENKYEHPKPEKTPDPVVMLTPMGPLPVVPAPHPIVKPVEQKRPEITTTKPVNSDHIPEVRKTMRSTGKRESVEESLQIHCHTCGNMFHPKHAKRKFCSKKCYMIEWYEVHRKPKDLPEIKCETNTVEISPPANQPLPTSDPSSKDREDHLKELSAKLKKIRENDPAPSERPNITRELL